MCFLIKKTLATCCWKHINITSLQMIICCEKKHILFNKIIIGNMLPTSRIFVSKLKDICVLIPDKMLPD